MIISFLRRGPFLSAFSSLFILVRLNYITIIRRRTQRSLHQRNNQTRNKEIFEYNNMSGSKRKYVLFLSWLEALLVSFEMLFFIKFHFIIH